MSGTDNAYSFLPKNPSTEFVVPDWQWRIQQVVNTRRPDSTEIDSAHITLYPSSPSDSRLEARILSVEVVLHQNGVIESHFNILTLPRGINLVARLRTTGGSTWHYLENGYELIPGRVDADASVGA